MILRVFSYAGGTERHEAVFYIGVLVTVSAEISDDFFLVIEAIDFSTVHRLLYNI